MTFSKRSGLLIFIGAACTLGLLFSLPYKSAAVETGLDWLNGTITVSKEGDYQWAEGENGKPGNIPCEPVGAYLWSRPSGWSVKSLQNNCATPGASVYMTWQKVLPFGAENWQVLNLADSYHHAWTFPNTGTNGMAMVTNSYADYVPGPSELYYTDDVLSTFSTLSKDIAGNIVRSPSKLFDRKLTYSDGRSVSLTGLSGISYSANGRWLYVNINGVGQLRIDVNDFSVFSFASGFVPQYAMYTAISNSGNTAVTHQFNQGLKLYDLTSCEAEKSDYASRNCASRDLTQNLRDAVLETLANAAKLRWIDVSDIKFVNESELRLLVHYVYDNQEKYMFMNMKTAAAEQPVRYLALGDSFSSGEGAGNYYEATNFYADTNNYNFCHQSRLAYSELLNSWLKPEFYDSIACSGAQMKDVISRKAEDYANSSDAQAKSAQTAVQLVQSAKQSNLPGYIPQIFLIDENKASISTISIGGNDIGFKDIIMSCVMNDECYISRDDKEKLADLIASKIPGLSITFATIKHNMSGPTPKLYVLGYPRLFAERSCGQFMGIEEQEFANHLVDYLDDAVRLAAARAGVFYVDVSHAFYDGSEQGDHRLCGKAAPAANGAFFDKDNMTDGQPLLDSIFRALVSSYHPNALGHQLLAGAIRQQTEGFSAKMPVGGATSQRPAQTLYSALVGDTADVYRELGDVTQDITKDVVVEAGQSIDVSYSLGLDGNGLPIEGATITVVAQSTPMTLGTLTVQPDGTTSGNFSLPSSLEPGVHTIHLFYTDISGQTHDVYQYIYLIANETDFDGDGVPNSQEVCIFGNAMGVDQNTNGLDDACDSDTFTGDTAKQSITVSPAVQHVSVVQGSAEQSNSLGHGWLYDISATLPYMTSRELENPESNHAGQSSNSNGEDVANGPTLYAYLTLGFLFAAWAMRYLVRHKRF